MARPPKHRAPSDAAPDDEEPTEIGEPLDDSDEQTEPAGAPLAEALGRLRENKPLARAKGQTAEPRANEPGLVPRPVRKRTSMTTRSATPRTKTVTQEAQRRAQVTHALIAAAPGGKRERTAVSLVAALERAVQSAQVQRLPFERLRASFKVELLPLLRQAVEKAGGDGLDAYLSPLVSGKERRAQSPLLGELLVQLDQLDGSRERATLVASGKRLVGSVKRAFSRPISPLSTRVLDGELESRVEVDTVLAVLFSSMAELAHRRTETDHLLENIRLELRSSGGRYSETMFRSFSRLKTEKRLIEAEEARRSRPRKR